MRAIRLLTLAALLLSASTAWAQSGIIAGSAVEAGDRVPMAAPVKATMGHAALGAVTGWLVDHSAQQITVGQALPDSVLLRQIPRHETYRYAVMNGHRFIVDASTRMVVYIID